MKITKKHARKVLAVVDQGLVQGVGIPVPGKMCVEAAVCFALGLPHGDKPECVSPVLRKLKIKLNDAMAWPDNTHRAKGLRALAVLQLGTQGELDEEEFSNRLVVGVTQEIISETLARAAKECTYEENQKALLSVAEKCKNSHTWMKARDSVRFKHDVTNTQGWDNDYSTMVTSFDICQKMYNVAGLRPAWDLVVADVTSAVNIAASNGNWRVLVKFATIVADILIAMKVPAVKWLDLLDINKETSSHVR